MIVKRQVCVSNELGIHLRAAGIIVQVAGVYSSSIWLERDTMKANAKSIMSVLALAASKGVELRVVADGDDAEEAVAALVDLIDGGFHV